MDLLHLKYQLRSGHYYLYDMRDAPNVITGERPYRLKTEMVAIAFDRITGLVHKHGQPTRINSWAMGTQRRLRIAGDWDEADRLVVVSGPLPEDEINKCLRVKGYCRWLLNRLANMPHGKFSAYQNAKRRNWQRHEASQQRQAA
ncbi:hypothetical protein KUF54_13140 [Comamonas sp. Y33R10-2]|nr:hypothetical protein KUF54_13140 [Comamonas sp. Y33R10-2]